MPLLSIISIQLHSTYRKHTGLFVVRERLKSITIWRNTSLRARSTESLWMVEERYSKTVGDLGHLISDWILGTN